MDSKLSHTVVSKAVKCYVTTVTYWLKQSKDLSDSIQAARAREINPKQVEQIVSLIEQQTFVTARDIANE